MHRAVPLAVLRGGLGGWRRESVPRRALRLCPRRGPTQANAPPPPPDRRPRGGPDGSLDGEHAAAGRERRQRPERRCLQGALQALLCARAAHGAAPLAASPADDAAAPSGGRARAQGQIARRVAPWAAPPRNLAPNIKLVPLCWAFGSRGLLVYSITYDENHRLFNLFRAV